jgi:hypothetical protein
MNNRKEIFTTGYPKSGNTWLWRLLCEIFDAPLQNNDNLPITYIFPKERDREKYVVRKLHMPMDKDLPTYSIYSDDIRERCKKGYLIFIHRDPRSVVCSSMNFKNDFDLKKAVISLCDESNSDIMIYSHYLKWVNSYLEQKENCDVIIKYEDLLENPLCELRKIVDVIETNINDNKIKEAININNFDQLKKENPTFYWKGKTDTWKEYFNQEMGKYLTVYMGDFMLKYGYIASLDWWKELKK